MSSVPDIAPLIVSAPVWGLTAALATVPDPAFSRGMMGDGVAIHPLGETICAPCDGEVVALHASAHAVAIRSVEGAELLIHVGLETVALKGRGFTALVAAGDAVRRGDPLIRFDLDLVALEAASMLTPVLVTNGEDFSITRRSTGQTIAIGTELMVLHPKPARNRAASHGGGVASKNAKLGLPHGIHARPAARIGECARGFVAEVEILVGSKRASARSPLALLALGSRLGDEVIVEARGPDAPAAAEAIATLLASDMEEIASVGPSVTEVPIQKLAPGQVAGIIAAPGLAMGKAARLKDSPVIVAEHGRGAEVERAALAAARAAVREQLTHRATNGGTLAAILQAHAALLDDPQLIAASEKSIAFGASAAAAWRNATRDQATALQQSGNPRLSERSADIIDIQRQVLAALLGTSTAIEAPPAGAILVSGDLLPSQLVSLAEEGLGGVCLEGGGPTSHVAILCAGMGIPALVAMGDGLAAVKDGATLLLDAEEGVLTINPCAEQADAFASAVANRMDRRTAARGSSSQECQTLDGTRIHIFANIASVEDARLAAAEGAEGSGLVRSEFLFLGRNQPPSEDDQLAAYQQIADALAGKPVLIRLLDVGGDKPAAYIPIPNEENPALGVRGIRVGFAHPELLRTQIRAILRVRRPADCRIMIPMVASVDEVRAVRAMVDEARAELGIAEPVEVGVMIETPAAAMTVDLLARVADFVSVGTNDLTQYVLAMDRGNPAVAPGVDALHPAVLRMVAETCRLASSEGRWVGVCGGLASDPAALPILVGLGVAELSCVPNFVAEGKAIIRAMNRAEASDLAAHALSCVSAREVRTLAREFANAAR